MHLTPARYFRFRTYQKFFFQYDQLLANTLPVYGQWQEETFNQQIRNINFLENYSFDPASPNSFLVDNIVQRTLAHLIGQGISKSLVIRCSEAGALYVAIQGSGFSHNEVISGNAPDAYGAASLFSAICSRIIIVVWDQDMFLKRSFDNVVFDAEIEIPANSTLEIDVTTLAINARNKTVGFSARYQIIGFR